MAPHKVNKNTLQKRRSLTGKIVAPPSEFFVPCFDRRVEPTKVKPKRNVKPKKPAKQIAVPVKESTKTVRPRRKKTTIGTLVE